MNIKELRNQVVRLYENQCGFAHEPPEDIIVGIVIKPGGVGGTSVVGIKSIQAGFDWDNGKLMIYPEKDLRVIESDELLAMRKAIEKEEWAQYENRGLKSDIKKLNAKIALLEISVEQGVGSNLKDKNT